jgi:mannose-6-phosphate isomerase-like protein (cupin superfamily)
MSISVDVGKPLPPRYLYHPKNTDPALARSFGAAPGKTLRHDPDGAHPLQQQMARYVIRHGDQPTLWDPAGFSRKVYVGPGGIVSDTCRKEMLGLPPKAGVKPFSRDVEDAMMVLEGTLTVGWEQDGEQVEMELGPRDMVLNPAGRRHWFRNNGAGACTVWSVIGSAEPETVRFEAA